MEQRRRTAALVKSSDCVEWSQRLVRHSAQVTLRTFLSRQQRVALVGSTRETAVSLNGCRIVCHSPRSVLNNDRSRTRRTLVDWWHVWLLWERSQQWSRTRELWNSWWHNRARIANPNARRMFRTWRRCRQRKRRRGLSESVGRDGHNTYYNWRIEAIPLRKTHPIRIENSVS